MKLTCLKKNKSCFKIFKLQTKKLIIIKLDEPKPTFFINKLIIFEQSLIDQGINEKSGDYYFQLIYSGYFNKIKISLNSNNNEAIYNYHLINSIYNSVVDEIHDKEFNIYDILIAIKNFMLLKYIPHNIHFELIKLLIDELIDQLFYRYNKITNFNE